jgi:hypothetical protein
MISIAISDEPELSQILYLFEDAFGKGYVQNETLPDMPKILPLFG